MKEADKTKDVLVAEATERVTKEMNEVRVPMEVISIIALTIAELLSNPEVIRIVSTGIVDVNMKLAEGKAEDNDKD